MPRFKDLLTLPALHTFVKEEGFRHPTPVQASAIPRLISGKSVSVLAQTGSGKTLAYALPIAELLKKREEDDQNDEPQASRTPVAWILCPTLELGAQVERVFKSIAHRAKLRVRHVKKGDTPKQTRATMAGQIDVLIGTPSRIRGALESGELKADAASFVICDEVDLLFDPGFLPDVQAVMSHLSVSGLQVGLFSATMPGTFKALRKECFPGVKFDELILQGTHTLKDNIGTINQTVPFKDKLEHSVGLIKELHGPGFLFVNLKRTAQEVFGHLVRSFPDKKIHLLHGSMERPDRRKALARFVEDGDVLVCTDIVARGIDLAGMNWVVNYDLPFEPVYYIHRCGRVGRRGEPAKVYNLVTTKDFPLIARINEAIASQSSLKLSRVVGKSDPARGGKPAGQGRKAAAGRKPARGKSDGTAPRRGKSAGGRPTSGKPSGGKPSRGKPASGRPTSGKPSGGKPSRGKPASGRPTSGKPAGGKPSRGKPAGGRPAKGKPAGGRKASGKSRGGKGR